MPLSDHVFGWVKQKEDPRDRVYCAAAPVTALPRSIDLRTVVKQPAIFDQGRLGSCVGNASAFCHQYDQQQQLGAKPGSFTPSRLFIYYGARELEGSINQDAGCAIRDAVKVLNKKGVCKESTWPYNISMYAKKPAAAAYTEALKSTTTGYYALNGSVSSIKQALVDGHPVVYGFQVYSSFDKVGADGLMPVPNPRNEKLYGGHAISAVGYDDSKAGGCFIVRNSWGTVWGLNGYFYMPYAVVEKGLCSDFWVLSQVTLASSGPVPVPKSPEDPRPRPKPHPRPEPEPEPQPEPEPEPQPEPQPNEEIKALLDNVEALLAQIRSKI